MDSTRSGRFWAGAITVALAAILVSGVHARVQRSGKPSIYVLAVKDSGVLTMCPDLREAKINGKTWKPDGRAVVGRQIDGQQYLRFPPRQSKPDSTADPRLRTEFSGTMATLPIPASLAGDPNMPAPNEGVELGRDVFALDASLRLTIELELVKLGTHRVAESLESADLVMVVESSYAAMAGSSSVTTPSGQIPNPPPALGAVMQAGDWQRNLLQSILAVTAPAEVYRSNPGDIRALMAARIWEGSEVAQSPYRVSERTADRNVTRYETNWTWEHASPSALMWQFAGKKPRPASHLPLCAASNQTFRVGPAPSSVPADSAASRPGTLAAAPSAAGAGSPVMFKGGVTYVTVPVSVIDPDGKTLTNLDPSSFRIYEDDKLQSVDRLDRPGAPVSVSLLVDTSSSMRRKYAATGAATKAAVAAFKDVGTLSMTSFDRRVTWYPTPPEEVIPRLDDPDQPSPTVGRSATRFYDAIDLLLTGPLKAASGRTALVILTDGVDTASRLASADGARRRLGESHTPAYIIQYDTQKDGVLVAPGRGFDMVLNGTTPELTRRLVPEDAADPGLAYARAGEFLRDIADLSGGRRYPATADVSKTLAEIATEITQQYTLAYYPSNQARDGTYRRIRVEVDRPGARVRARAGYLQVTAR